jgi:predicted transcriptional regulator
MSNKQIVEDLLQRIPEDASLRDIARQIEFVDAVRQGLAELDCAGRIPIEEVEREIPSWIICKGKALAQAAHKAGTLRRVNKDMKARER